MENNVLRPSAYHEAGRVVFTYLCGYLCDAMEIPGVAGSSGSKLNSGNDLAAVQAVFSGNPIAMPAANLGHGIEVAKKLMTIYCAGTCTETFFNNNAEIPEELDMDIPAQDMKYIEKIQGFLKKASVDHPDDFPEHTIVTVFHKLKDPTTWKAIEMLAAKMLQAEDNSVKRFYIEDTLMVAGIRPQRSASAVSAPAFAVGVREDETPRSATSAAAASVAAAPVAEKKTTTFDLSNFTPLDIMLRDFLKRIKSDWQGGELDAAVKYLNDIFKKYGE